MDLKNIMFYVAKHIAALAVCYDPALVRDKPLGAHASVICETGLYVCMVGRSDTYTKISTLQIKNEWL